MKMVISLLSVIFAIISLLLLSLSPDDKDDEKSINSFHKYGMCCAFLSVVFFAILIYATLYGSLGML